MAKADDAFAIAQRLFQRHAQGNAHIFVGVVIVNFVVALGLHGPGQSRPWEEIWCSM
jgi:hypothetical protein